MPYTNFELVKGHIALKDTPADSIRDYPVIFTANSEIYLPGKGIIPGSMLVKASGPPKPSYGEYISGVDPIVISGGNLIPNSVVIASNRSLSTIYRDNIDYAITYASGEITIIPDGAIASGQPLSIWYEKYIVYAEGVDYSVNYTKGYIRRLVNGDINIGQRILVDYDSAWHHANDAIVTITVNEANAIVEREVDPDKSFGADPVLQAAATYLAASILCRIAAAGDLEGISSASRGASSWLALSDNFRKDYEHLIKIFHPERSRPSGPRRS